MLTEKQKQLNSWNILARIRGYTRKISFNEAEYSEFREKDGDSFYSHTRAYVEWDQPMDYIYSTKLCLADIRRVCSTQVLRTGCLFVWKDNTKKRLWKQNSLPIMERVFKKGICDIQMRENILRGLAWTKCGRTRSCAKLYKY